VEVVIRPDADTAAMLVARLVGARVRAKPDLVLGLATGRTMERVYGLLAAMALDFSGCRSFNLDEYIGVPAEDEHSYRHYMNKRLFDRIDIEQSNTHVPDGMAPDLGAEAARYERLIWDAGGIDLQLLGIGDDGHIGFNEPLSALMSRTRAKALTATTRQQNAAMFGGDADRAERLGLPKSGDKAPSLTKPREANGKPTVSGQAVETFPSRASSIRSCRDTLYRNPGRIMGPVESNSDPLGKGAGPDSQKGRV